MERKTGRNWKFRVVKQYRGMRGQWCDAPTAATFILRADADEYASEFASQQAAAGVRGVRITVRERSNTTGPGWVFAV